MPLVFKKGQNMKSVIIISLLTCISLPAFADSVDTNEQFQDSIVTSSHLVPENSQIMDYVNDLARDNSALGIVMTDVINIKKNKCQLDMGMQDIKLIASKDDTFKNLEEKVDKNPGYNKSFEYKNAIDRHFGKCF